MFSNEFTGYYLSEIAAGWGCSLWWEALSVISETLTLSFNPHRGHVCWMFNFAFYLCRVVVPLKLEIAVHTVQVTSWSLMLYIIKKSTEQLTVWASIQSFPHHDVCVIAVLIQWKCVIENLSEKLMDRRVDAKSVVLKQGDALGGLSTLPWWLQDGLKWFKTNIH